VGACIYGNGDKSLAAARKTKPRTLSADNFQLNRHQLVRSGSSRSRDPQQQPSGCGRAAHDDSVRTARRFAAAKSMSI